MATVKPSVTVGEFLRMCGDGHRRELVRGEVVELGPTSVNHGRIAMRIASALHGFVLGRGLGEVYVSETGFVLSRSPDTVRAPDVAFVRRERLDGVPDDGFFPGAPDLAVEVVSPSDLASEVERKVRDYLAAGVRLVWVIYPETRHVVVYRPGGEARILGEDAVLDGEQTLPGFALPAHDLFGP